MYYQSQNRKHPIEISSRLLKQMTPRTYRTQVPSSEPTRQQRVRILNHLNAIRNNPPINTSAHSPYPTSHNPFHGFDSFIKYRDLVDAIEKKQLCKYPNINQKLISKTKLLDNIKNAVSDRNKFVFLMSALSVLHSTPKNK